MLSDADAEALGELYEQGLEREKAGDVDRAVSLYHDCLKIDPDDHCGVSVRLAVMGREQTPTKAPDAYVATLFDQHAADFDQILTGDLGYAVPMQIASAFETLPERRFNRMLDLGCGTGLCGLTLGPICDHVTGVDLSEKMTDEADERAVYDLLFVHEATSFLDEWAQARATLNPDEYQRFDLIVAADVLPYIGDLAPLIAGICKNLTQGGTIALSCETLPDQDFDDRSWRLTPHQRFAHHLDYLTGLLRENGLSNFHHINEIVVRYEEGKPIPGWLIIASLASTTPENHANG